ncbi:MAG TPA: flagellar filament capping protein FliD, partial [Candidatus Deferrimicrobium sp.]|nr:flagellar filament capping protein FliD [Candidatus Deferrimicrobium sp.]
FIERFNEVNDFINKQNTYNKETKESGVLFGDSTLQMMQNSLRSVLSSRVSGLQGKYTSLLAVGIHTTASGTLEIVNSGRLETALNENLGEVIRLFTSSGSSSSNFIEFVSSTTTTKPGKDYVVDITQAATGGRLQGSGIADPAVTPLTLSSSSNRLKLVVDGLTSNEIVLTEKTYTSTDQLVQEIQGKIDADAGIGGRGLTVTWVDSGSGMGYLNFTSSTYGSSSKVQAVTSIANNAYGVLGLAAGASLAGTDVAGTINGEAAEGRGQFLTGKDGNRTTAGLKLRVTLDPSQVGDGSEGTISVTKGLAARMADVVGSFTKVKDGLFDRKTAAVQNQVSTLQERIDDFEERLTMRRDSLLKKFYAMESALGQLNAQSQYLTNQLAGISSNWLSNKR